MAPELERTREQRPRPNLITVLDGGAQYADLIVRNCQRLGYNTRLLPLDTPFEDIADSDGFVITGGPDDVFSEDATRPDEQLWETDKPVLGICLGQQLMAQAFGGKVEAGSFREDAVLKTKVDHTHPIFAQTGKEIQARFTHGNFVTGVPEGFDVIGSHDVVLDDGSNFVVNSAIAKDNFVGVQFHPEVFDDTPHGYEIFKGFFTGVGNIDPDEELLNMLTESDVEKRIATITEQAGDRQVIAFVSGGIDSTIAAFLAQKALSPEKLHFFYFDNGFMRDEDDDVIDYLQSIGIDVTKIDATENFEQATWTDEEGKLGEVGKFWGPLICEGNPAAKRKIIGQKFVDLMDVVAESLGLDPKQTMLLQGTNAADRIESGFSLGGGNTEQIVEHHNQVAGIKALEAAGQLIEPLVDIHKDEIRRIGDHFGLPEEIVWRQPFPGPGNAIRIICTPEEMNIRGVNERLHEFMVKEAGGNLVGQVLPIRSGGVSGDGRTRISPVAIQGLMDWDLMEHLAIEIPKNFKDELNRVIFALGENSIKQLSITPTSLGREERGTLRHADRIVHGEMRDFELYREISQLPVVLLPLSFSYVSTRSIVLRPVRTSTFLTAKALTGNDLPQEFFIHSALKILNQVHGISQVFTEITGKPPGRTEWE